MAIIVPDRRIWTSQPQVPVGINWSNPLTRGLVLSANYATPQYDAAGYSKPDITRTIGIGPEGKCLSGTSGLVSYPSSSLLTSATGSNQSRTILFMLSTVTTGNTVIAEKGENTNFVCQTLNSKFSWRVAGSGGEAISTTSNITSGRPVRVAGVLDGTTQRVFFNGADEGSNTISTADADNTSPFVVGAREGNLYAFPGDIYLCYVWNRALSASEVKSISDNPWQIFRPQEDFIFVGTGGGGAVTGNLAATESADTFAVAGIVLVQGALTSTETSSDTFAGTGDASAEIIGNLSSTESGTDALAVVGSVKISGSFASTESGIDTFAGTGDASDIVFGNLNATEGADGFAAIGSVDVIGSLAGMEVGADSILISGNSVRTGYLDAMESGVDSFAATQPSVLTLTAGDLAAIRLIMQEELVAYFATPPAWVVPLRRWNGSAWV